ncbi:AraC-like DNA-binding protein [Arthrobacter sp. UYEF21]
MVPGYAPLNDPATEVCEALRQASFARKFSAEAGMTPLNWLNDQRMAEACRILESTDLTVQAVASRTGLGTRANFRQHGEHPPDE